MRVLIIVSLLLLASCKDKETVTPKSNLSEVQTYDSLFLYNRDSLLAGKTNGWVLKYSLNNAVDADRIYWYKRSGDNSITTEFAVIGSLNVSEDTISVGGHYNTQGFIVRY